MDEKAVRVRDDLRDVVTGDILIDDLARAAYSTDASILQVRPLAIVAPRSVQELTAVVKYAAENGLAVHPRGAGTGLAGESLGSGLMIDTSRYLNRILDTGLDTVRVEPGVRWSDLQRHLAARQRMFAPDPVSGDRCTLGGMLATNAAGPHSLRYGTTRDHVLGLRLVLAGGELVEVGRETLPAHDHGGNQSLARIVTAVYTLLGEHEDAIAKEQPPTLLKPGGYDLRGVRVDSSLDLARLLVGSEGTLAVFAEAVLATLRAPKYRGILLVGCNSLDTAAQVVIDSLDYRPSACELMDRRLLSMIRDAEPVFRDWVPDDAEALLLLEQDGDSEETVREQLRAMADRLTRLHRAACQAVLLFDEPDLARCWRMRHQASSMLARSSGPEEPAAFVENAAVPPAELPAFLKRVQDIMKRHEVTASYAAHAGVGVLHTRPLLDLRRPEQRAKLEAIALAVQHAALELGGTNNGEHGVGLLRSGLIQQQYPRLYPVFCQLKAVFDPHNHLNPGKIVGAEPGLPILHLRTIVAPSPASGPAFGGLQLLWPELSMAQMAARCNGCGSCRTAQPSRRMCPTFKAFPTELASPRAKANLMRQIVTGVLDPRTLASDEFREVADLCVHCKMCRVECPSAVDISKLMLEAKSANVAEHGLSPTNWILAHLDAWSKWASGNAGLANALLALPIFRWLAERLLGISRRRQLPRYHHQTFLRRAARNGWTRKPRPGEPRPKVALLADVFVNHNDPLLGECAVRVLEHQGRKVYVPPNQCASGMAALQIGDLETARARLNANLGIFAELAREGYDIVSPEPAAVLMFRDEARHLTGGPDAELVRDRTYELSEYLAHLADRGELRDDFQPIPLTIGYHEPCHLRALAPRSSIVALVERIPKLRVVPIDLGCSGMAGTYGMRADSFHASLAAGSALLERLARPDLDTGMTQCFPCRMQMEQGARKRTLHPAKWLMIAYGLLDRPDRLLTRPRKGLVLS